jgi:uncharacterized protein (DUF885 family)
MPTEPDRMPTEPDRMPPEPGVVGTPLGGVDLPRPAPAADRGPLDDRFYDLVEARFRRVVAGDPLTATYLGIHAWDDRLPDASRERVEADIAADRTHLAAIEALDPAGLSTAARFERELELHNLRLHAFEVEEIRTWERRSAGIDAVGEAVYVLFSRDFAPLAERLDLISARLEQVPELLHGHQGRARGPQVRLWQEQALRSAEGMPAMMAELTRAAADVLPASARRRLAAATEHALAAIGEHTEWVFETLARGTDDWALGAERYDALLALRAFDGLAADAILAIGEEQLAANHAARAAAAREMDPRAPTEVVVERVKDDHPSTFDEALAAYREAMTRARAHLVANDVVSVPDDERILVIETPEYLRGVMPFAAYYSPAPFDRDPLGLYVVTPSVDGDEGALREHYRAAISNTSIHEAYPGHHLQLALAARHPSLTRLQTDAPEFVEGWGMYSEQMIRETGFDDGPAFRIALTTDAIWRACRIILDVRMHRGEVPVEAATDFLVHHTRFERPHALAEVRRYTSTPGYQLSYLLGKVLLLRLRDEERERLGPAFRLRDFHDALLRNGSLPISFQRRLLRGEDRPPSSGGVLRAAARHA